MYSWIYRIDEWNYFIYKCVCVCVIKQRNLKFKIFVSFVNSFVLFYPCLLYVQRKTIVWSSNVPVKDKLRHSAEARVYSSV